MIAKVVALGLFGLVRGVMGGWVGVFGDEWVGGWIRMK